MCLSSPEDQNPIPCSYAEKPLPHYFVQFYSCLHWEGEPKTCYAIMVGGRPYLFKKKKNDCKSFANFSGISSVQGIVNIV